MVWIWILIDWTVFIVVDCWLILTARLVFCYSLIVLTDYLVWICIDWTFFIVVDWLFGTYWLFWHLFWCFIILIVLTARLVFYYFDYFDSSLGVLLFIDCFDIVDFFFFFGLRFLIVLIDFFLARRWPTREPISDCTVYCTNTDLILEIEFPEFTQPVIHQNRVIQLDSNDHDLIFFLRHSQFFFG